MTLKELQIGKSAIVDAVGGAGALRQHFLDMGLIPGACTAGVFSVGVTVICAASSRRWVSS